MTKDTGSLSVGERIEKIEERLEAHERIEGDHVTNLWKKITEIEIEMAKSSTKIAVIVSVLCTVGSFAVQYMMKKMGV